jgi:hypothetical protein
VALGLGVPSGVRRNALRLARWTVVGVLWVVLVISSLPALVVAAAMFGLHLMPESPDVEGEPSPGPFNVWEQVVARLAPRVGSGTSLFKDTMLVSDDRGVLQVRMGPDLASLIVALHVDDLKAALTEIGRVDAGVEFVSGEFRVRAI